MCPMPLHECLDVYDSEEEAVCLCVCGGGGMQAHFYYIVTGLHSARAVDDVFQVTLRILSGSVPVLF